MTWPGGGGGGSAARRRGVSAPAARARGLHGARSTHAWRPARAPTLNRSSRPTMLGCFVWSSTCTSEASDSCSFLLSLSVLISFTAASWPVS
jgi:hypothetical protein